ncbi:MAG: phosphoribosylamine--glycine ligase [Acidobacteria bacterium]|nr:MAG: phosphoribosylamine--glycine ligase [Acidobacteriota bacterium]
MNLLVVGSGAREHALAWKLSRDTRVTRIACAPGNAGIAALATLAPVDVGDPDALLALAEAQDAHLTVVGPELPLTRGVADLFAARGRLLLGPTHLAAELESSKAFAKDFMRRHRVPTAAYEVCDTSEAALGVLASGRFGYPVVLKADGLAAGKGVVIATDPLNARLAVRAMMVDLRFGEAGRRIVVEECMRGPELSVFALTDGRRALLLPSAQDHKRAYDNDQGPNTGGMGAFAPSPLADEDLLDRVRDTIILPVLEGMRAEGREFRGFLYAGLMITAEGPKVVEFNVRLGDPEAQVVLPMIDGDLAPLLRAAAEGNLGQDTCRVRDWPHVGVVLASKGYPDSVETGKVVTGLGEAEGVPGVTVFHAGTARRGGDIVTSGGRVLTVVGEGKDFRQAISRAYEAAGRIHFDGVHYRRDIGKKVVIS